ncbi:hypothetical protein DD238_000353 [Peronospora effusa]|uniref:Ubiquitinyl hydrolase 1 n=1 Tax=Peronospora effusa TaxID=542832 RepID=A0A3M6VLP5_9STRA|nr:hypothetical protein DD238_000353 [Peronospora effusa]
MTDLVIHCVNNVVLEVTRDDGEITRSTLQKDLVLRKEVGNARLVSDDAVLWIGNGVLSHKDSALDSAPTRTVRVENNKRRFVFTVPLDTAGRQFYAELKDQVDGKAGVEIRKKKRKIRKQLSQVMGFTPVNTLKSPLKSPSPLLKSPANKSPMTIKRSPLADIRMPQQTPQLTLPPPLPVTTKGSTLSLTSPLRSPFRSPFRKKARHSQSPSHGLGDSKSPSLRSPAREWLSPTRSQKMLRSGPTPPDLKRHSSHTSYHQPSTEKVEGYGGSSGEPNRRKVVTGAINKRVRSLQLILDDESAIEQHEAEEKKKITSRFFKMSSPQSSHHNMTASALDVSMESVATVETDHTDGTNASTDDSLADEPLRSTHGLLNLGNYCYMNAVVQALAALPEFVNAVQNEENLLKIIRRQPQPSVNAKTMDQLKTIVEDWRNSGDTKHLPLQYALGQLLQLVINGSETSINPEPLKNVMGKKNSIFASHFQQDAHEFLLNLVTEYENELVGMVHEVTEKIQEEAKSSPQVQRTSLLGFFRNGSKVHENKDATENKSAEAEMELICRLPPAKCFRAELNRTLTCRHCGYSRKQAETFYDFSLDLPYYPFPDQEPTAEQEPQAPPSPERQCFCNLTPSSAGTGDDRYYCCSKSSCSYREKFAENEGSAYSPTKTTDTVMKSVSSPLTPAPGWQARPAPIELETLLRKQFDTEVLEVTCEKCKSGKEAESAYRVKSLPSILVLHLKRFEVNPHTGALFKRCDPVIPPSVIDPTRSINNSASSGYESRYVLKSVIHHLGNSIDEGHYVADVCDARGQWIRRNDTHESKISEDYALQSYRSQESCYMFFYVKSERNRTDDSKENVPMNRASPQDENDENSSQQRQGTSSKDLRAFLFHGGQRHLLRPVCKECFRIGKKPVDLGGEPEALPIRSQGDKKTASLADFQLLSVIGQGAFGKVLLVRHATTGKIRHPFVIGLHYAFQTESKVYLVMEYQPGGELFSYLKEEGTFTEQRHVDLISDLKPENVLISAEGHIKLTDFGLAKEYVEGQDLLTVCGTKEYMAPEMLLGKGYDSAVDWWSLGALAHEMLTGNPPFRSKNTAALHKKILSAKLQLPRWLSGEAHSLIKSLLERNVSKRLGGGKSSMFVFKGVQALKRHPFFKTINWKEMETLRIPPPKIPSVSDEADTSNFDTKFTEMTASDLMCEAVMEGHSNLFRGFSFCRQDSISNPQSPINTSLLPTIASLVLDGDDIQDINDAIASAASKQPVVWI